MLKPLLIIIFSLITSLHDFHVTHTTIHYNNSNETIEITIKVAIEDLERVVGGKEGNELRIGTVNENKLVDKLIIDYFSNRLKISLNNWNATYQWVGKKIIGTVANVSPVKGLESFILPNESKVSFSGLKKL